MNEEQAKQLMKDGKVSNYTVIDGKVDVKAEMDKPGDTSWPAVNDRSK